MRNVTRWMVAGIAAWMVVAAAWAEEATPSTDGLKHAVVCPPFKGNSELAELYHGELTKMLRKAEGVEFLEGSRASSRRLPEFSFRIVGRIEEGRDGESFIAVALVDNARKEQIASLVSPASDDAGVVAAWRHAMQRAIQRRSSKLPFESRVRRQRGQNSLTLDRGLGSGLQPGMMLYLAADEELLISPQTGAVIGRDSPRALGQIEVFRVMENSAYARPAAGTKLPRTGQFFAKTF